MKLEYSRQNFEKYSNIKLIKILSVATKLFCADGQTDSHDEVNSRFSQFRQSA